MTNYNELTMKQIDAAYINSLVDLVNACRHYNVKIDEVRHHLNGWHVTFAGHPHADAICHDHSYGSPYYMCEHTNDWERNGEWETIGFPWDDDDVSVHTAEELAFYLYCLDQSKANPWKYKKNC